MTVHKDSSQHRASSDKAASGGGIRAKVIRLFRKKVTFPQTEAPPVIENAPGIVWKWLKDKRSWEARWYADKFAIKLGYPTRYARIWYGEEPSEQDRHYIADSARAMQDQMEIWLKNWRWTKEEAPSH
jgi:hypothetical protein